MVVPVACSRHERRGGRHIRDLGITDTAKVFHSFRHNFKDALRAAGIGQEIHDALTGHSTRGEVSREYGAKDMTKRFGWETLASAVAKVAYPGVDLSGIRPAKRTTRAPQAHGEIELEG